MSEEGNEAVVTETKKSPVKGGGEAVEEKVQNGEGGAETVAQKEEANRGDSTTGDKSPLEGTKKTEEKKEEVSSTCETEVTNSDGDKSEGKEKTTSVGTKEESTEPKVETSDKKVENADTSSSTSTKEEKMELEEEKADEEPPKVKLERLIRDGANSLLIKKDPEEAAECLGIACEKARELYGEMGDECAEVFFLYGCSMLECSKILENTVFGEKIPKEEESSDDDEGEEEEEAEQQIVLTKKTSMAIRQQEKEKQEAERMEGEDTAEETEEEDNMLRAAWEMFELAKVIYEKQEKGDKVAEIYMKLGEVSVESGNPAAVEDMKKALEIRKRVYPEGDRIIPETHFHIGLAYSFFEMFDEAVVEFTTSKTLLDERIAALEKSDTDVAREEVKEIRDLIPDIDEKISDMIGSKEEKAKAERAKLNGEGSSASPKKEVTNISHLVKRKRKLDDVTSDLQTSPTKKHLCLEKESAEKKESTDESK